MYRSAFRIPQISGCQKYIFLFKIETRFRYRLDLLLYWKVIEIICVIEPFLTKGHYFCLHSSLFRPT